jgi:hypothetical protein
LSLGLVITPATVEAADSSAAFLWILVVCGYEALLGIVPAADGFWIFVGRPLADAPSACKQAAYRLKSKYNQALVF